MTFYPFVYYSYKHTKYTGKKDGINQIKELSSLANNHTKVSVLNLGPIRKGETKKDAIDDLGDLAQATEKMGYERYWIAEHHNTGSLISSATSILIKHVLEHTDKIRVGSGGIMLPNPSPLVVAEQFGTMANIYANREDIGVGRD